MFFFLGVIVLNTWVAKAEDAKDKEAKDVNEEHVVAIDSEADFESFIAKNKHALVEFYAPWCGHCKALAPEYAKAAEELVARGSKIRLAKIDATGTAGKAIADKFAVEGYPSLFFFRNGNKENYGGGRTMETIVKWVEKAASPAVEIVDDAEAAIKDVDDFAVVGYFKDKESDLYKSYFKLAEELRQRGSFYAVIGSDKPNGEVHFVRTEEGMRGTCEGEEYGKWKTCVETEVYPLFGAIHGENYHWYIKRNLEIVWFCGQQADFEKYKETMRKVGKAVRDKHSIVWLDTDKFKGHAEGSLALTVYPGLVVLVNNARYIFPNADELNNATKVEEFIHDVHAGKVKKTLKSQDIPATNEGPVYVVVGNTFEEMVLQKDKDVFLEVYAAWCGHCKKLEPVFDELGEKLRPLRDQILIAKIDGSENDSPHDSFSWKGFPTLFFVKAGTNVPIKYEGERTLKEMLEFIQKNASRKLELPTETPKADGKAEEL